MSETKSLPCTIFDHVLWRLESPDGEWQRGEIVLGECLLLFTSLDALQGYLNCCDSEEVSTLRPVIFSRNRKEFGARAREAVRQGLIGALIDPAPETGEAPFLRFSRLNTSRRQPH